MRWLTAKVGAAGSFDVSVNWIRDDGELLGTAPHEGEPPAVIVRLDANAANGNTLTFTVPWDDLYATISERPYAGVVGATIGRGQIRALVTMTKVGGDPGFELRSVSLEHTEYLRQIMGVEPPRLAISHRDRLWLAGGIFTQLSPVNRLEGWRAGDQEYYRAGGDRIEAMLSHERELLVFKRNAIFAVTGNSYHDWGKDKVLDNTGTSAVDGVLSVQGVVVYEDVSGRLAMLLQGEPRYITRHLADELGRNRGAGGRAALHQVDDGSFILLHEGGTGVDPRGYWIDPETLDRSDDGSEWRAAIWPFDMPGPVAASWGGLVGDPYIAVGAELYHWDRTLLRTDGRVRLSTYEQMLFAPPTRSSIRRLTIETDLDPLLTVTLRLYSTDAVGAVREASRQGGGIFMASVGEIGHGVELVEVEVNRPVKIRAVSWDTVNRRY